MVQLSFHGAAETVTGSKYLLEADGTKVLVDFGMFQGAKELRQRNWNPMPFDVKQVNSLILTHAHIDHIGLVPKLVRDGFRGPIYSTAATADISEITLFDAAKCQEEDADYANQKGYSKHKPALPLFDENDVRRSLKLFQPCKRGEWIPLGGPIFGRHTDVGHLLGSAMIEIEVRNGAKPTRILFSGDVGRYNAPLYFDPKPPHECDYLVCESTYGDRDHPLEPILEQVCETTLAAISRGGVMLISSFAIGRAQQLIYLLRLLMQQNRIPELPIYIDSPMAVDATNIYCTYSDEHDLSEGQLTGNDCVLRGKNVFLARSRSESKQINSVAGPAVIIASSGMMTGGRILHHLQQRLHDPKNTVVLGGFASEGTRARALADGARFLKLFGRDVPVRAAVARMPALSGHADRSELLRWLKPIADPKHVFLTHGELTAAQSFAETLKTERNWHNISIPKQGETVELV